MSILSVIHFLFFIGDIALIVIVIGKNAKAQLNRFCALVAGSCALWSLGYCFTHFTDIPSSALFWINISSCGWIIFPVAILYFYLSLTDKQKVIKNKVLMFASILCIAFFLYAQWSGNIIGTVIMRPYGWSGVWSTSVYSYLLYLYYIIVVIFFTYLVFDYGRKVKTNRERVQARILQITAITGSSLALIIDILLPVLNIRILPQMADIFISIGSIGIVICITRYGLMDINPITAAKQILETMTDTLILLDPEAKIKQANRAALELLEYKEKELINADFNEITATKKDSNIFLKNAIRRGKIVNEESTFVTKTGENIPVLISVSVIKDLTDTIAGFVILARDITEHKRLEESIRYHASLVASVSDAIVSRDNEYRILSWNKAAEEIYGWREDEVIGKNILDILKPVYLNATTKDIRASLDKTGYWKGESIQTCKDGTKLNIWDSVSMIRDERGNNIGTVALFKDITERKRMEQYLRESEENSRLQKELIERVLTTIPNAVFLLDKDLQVVMTNQAAHNILKVNGQKPESSLSGKTLEIYELNQALKDMIKSQENNTHVEFRRVIAEHERLLNADIFSMPKDEFLVVISDITEDREKQERLYLTDKLASVGEMASGVAHELNNPLTSIIGLSSFLVEQPIPESVDDIKEDLNAIYSEAKRCAAIVKNLLTFARQHQPTRQPLSAENIIKDVLKLRAYEHKANNITVKAKLPANLPQIYADYFQLQQAFLNIILNAESAMIDAHGQGTLKITGESIKNLVRISFSDNGPGIPKENLRLIFNPFFTTKEVGKGTGLGLSICYGIITSHDGKIYAKSEDGKGATFVVELPVYTQ